MCHLKWTTWAVPGSAGRVVGKKWRSENKLGKTSTQHAKRLVLTLTLIIMVLIFHEKNMIKNVMGGPKTDKTASIVNKIKTNKVKKECCLNSILFLPCLFRPRMCWSCCSHL